MSKFEHMKRLNAVHKSEIYGDFLGQCTKRIPEEYMLYVYRLYNLDKEDLGQAGARYIGGDYQQVKERIVNLHGGAVLEKANLAWNARNGKTYLVFEPCLWKRAPLILLPAKSRGVIEQVVGFVPWSVEDMRKGEVSPWHYSTPRGLANCSAPLFWNGDELAGAVIISSDPLRTIALRKHGFEAICIPMFCRWMSSWERKISSASRVYVDKADAEAYRAELEPIIESLAVSGTELRIVEVPIGADIMEYLERLAVASQPNEKE